MNMPLDLVPEPEALVSRVRFSLRGMLIGTAAAAACLAAVTPWFQAWNAEQKKAFLIFWGEFALTVTATVAFRCALRVRAERRAGPVRYRLRPSLTKFFAFLTTGGMVLLLGLSVCSSFLSAILADARTSAWGSVPHFVVIQLGMSTAGAALGIWWKSASLELCDGGILRDAAVAPWRVLSGFRWGSTDPNLLVLQYRRAIATFLVNPSDKAAVEQFLTSRLAANVGPADPKPVGGRR
jgi:hypothetical protein